MNEIGASRVRHRFQMTSAWQLMPVALIILATILTAFLLVLIWLSFGLFAGAFVFYFILYLFHIPLLAIALGGVVVLAIRDAMIR